VVVLFGLKVVVVEKRISPLRFASVEMTGVVVRGSVRFCKTHISESRCGLLIF